MNELRIAPDFTLPAEAVTQTFAILAKRGMGKTYTASVMAEEMLKAKSHVIIVDPVGVWWGLRAAADGSEGLPIVIAGGEHADIPLQHDAGELLADLVVDKRISIVLDLSLLRKAQQVRFMTDFAETLYRRNRAAVHLILDEADAFAPQRPMPGENAMLGAVEDIVRRGRARGIGVTMITQRPSVLNKNVLTQIEVLVALRLTAPLDQKAVDEWVKTHAEEGQRQEFMNSLPSLPVGTAWFWSPGWLNLFQKVQVRKRETMDSSSTPKLGEPVKAAKLAPIDIEALRDQLAAVIEKDKADDPTELKRQIKELEKRLVDSNTQVEIHQVEVLPKGFKAQLAELVETASAIYDQVNTAYAALIGLRDFAKQFSDASDTVSQFNPVTPITLVAPVSGGEPTYSVGFTPKKISDYPATAPTQDEIIVDQEAANRRQVAHAEAGGRRMPNERLSDPTQNEGTPKLTKAANTLLSVLAQYPSGRTKIQLSILSGYSKKSSSFSNALGELRSRGYISAAHVEPILITNEGLGGLEAMPTPLPYGRELIDYWLGKLKKAEQSMLRAATAAYPEALTYNELEVRTGYSRTSSSFSNALGKLRSLELIGKGNPVKASDIFFDGGK